MYILGSFINFRPKTCTGVIASMVYLGGDLDDLTVCFMILVIGFSVDYTSHLLSHYYRSGQIVSAVI